MTTLDHSTPTIHAVSRPVIAARFVQNVASYYRAWKNRRAFYKLGDMTDSELADIGLRRSDLFVAVKMPFGDDPTAWLTSVAQARSDGGEDAARRVC